MKNLSFVDKVLFFLNLVAAVFLLASYIIPYIPPKLTTTISVLSLGMSVLLITNVIFAIYWIVKLKKQFFLSVLILGLGFQHINAFIQFGKKESVEDTIKLMSYNIRQLRGHKWERKNDLDKDIFDFINTQSPDIISFQEHQSTKINQLNFPHKYIVKNPSGGSLCQAIYSKFKILNKGSLEFKKSGNNAIYADIIIEKDTLRIYNFHLQSYNINTTKENFGEKDSEKLFRRFKKTFLKQENQVEKILNHASSSPYKTIFMGDLNNTAFSWVYRQLKLNKKDAFIEAGNGFGKSFDYIFPFRIDFILMDPSISIKDFKTYNVQYSDHYPLMTRFKLTK